MKNVFFYWLIGMVVLITNIYVDQLEESKRANKMVMFVLMVIAIGLAIHFSRR